MSMPEGQGLYDPRNEHDACGVGFVAHSKGAKSHTIVRQGLQILENLEHRGAVGADPLMGDGAGIIIQTPDAFLRAEFAALKVTLPAVGDYGIGMIFLPKDKTAAQACMDLLETLITEEGQTVLGWRDVPVDPSCLGKATIATEPWVRQLAIGRGANTKAGDDFERRLYIIRKLSESSAHAQKIPGLKDFYICSFSSRTLVYKGMFLAPQLAKYYKDLHDERIVSALALVHQRFSTNTFPSWRLAHPYRMVCHNGEINTLRGNLNWMAARRHSMKSTLLGDDLKKLWPLIAEGQSDTASFDNALELLVQGGYSMAHAVMMMIPEAWAGNPLMDEQRKAFYEYHAGLMEPWDGPAAIAFTDGRQIGATLDRNGLRPARYLVTDDGLVVMASEAGVLDIPESKIVKKWRLQPGKMFLIDFEQGRIIDDAELKTSLAAAKPYKALLAKSQFVLEELPGDLPAEEHASAEVLLDRQQAFGYTQEDLNILLEAMGRAGEEATGSMGMDGPIAVLSSKAKLLYNYFKQNFAQVTNPPIDPIREELVMSLVSLLGPKPNLLGLDETDNHLRLEVRQPILTDADLTKIRRINELVGDAFKTQTLDITYPVANGADGMNSALKQLCAAAHEAVEKGFNILILSDRNVSRDRIAIPALLATASVHHHLIRMGLRTETGLVVETGEAREVHHFCTLAGYGAEAINPYLAFETLKAMRGNQLGADLPDEKLQKNFIKAIGKGMLKVMSKMGISTFQSYCGAQIFDAVGLSRGFIEKYFTGTQSAVDGIGLKEVAEETVQRHKLAFGNLQYLQNALDPGGDYAYRIRGEDHMWTPDTIAKLQHAARGNNFATYEEFSKLMNDQSERLMTLRGLFELKKPAHGISVDEVEPAASIVKRFASGAMSFGSISREAHTTLAIAMNRIGAKSNTGEGGEEADRFKPLSNGDSMRSAIKQVASGRFGVTAEYLVNADDIQIKMAQGAKPGEGGQLPGDKVNGPIAKVRHSTPGVGLISPPPHHDIYSIEDLAQLIHDLKNVNPQARISVKLVSEIGVGTVAAGVAKALADHVTIAGYEGGTGASPLTSVKHAGSPWEIGIAETHQTLVLNNLRGRIAVQVDGGFRTGRDVVIGALLGADEFGFATAPLIAMGCIMMRKCHLNTCPVGVATQNPELRKRFTGQPEHVINYLFFIAEEVRQLMAAMGFRKFEDMIGRSDLIDARRATDHYKAKGLDFSRLLHKPAVGPDVLISHKETQDHGLHKALDHSLIAKAKPAIEKGTPVAFESHIRNINRTVGAMLSGDVARKYGHAGLPEDTISVKFNGIAGQSFGAFLAKGVSFELVGAANDYTGKGLSGGRIAVYASPDCKAEPSQNIIVGNTTLYGAIEGECYFSGVAGERFAVRNSGAIAVVEGVGDHGCEYMTGGAVIVLGQTGRNFAAGMSGGIAYVLDEDGTFNQRCNAAMVELERIKPAPAPKGENGGLASLMADPLSNDVKRLYRLIERHSHYTNSARAKHILENWDSYLPKFVKVVPVDYRRALTNMAAAKVAADAPQKKSEAAHG
ncbi:MAG: glutamate synthase large subunit [Rhodospirillaceae bacterium]|nr:glutamate synthase large subunit [Rhodospirillaceae bacterium]